MALTVGDLSPGDSTKWGVQPPLGPAGPPVSAAMPNGSGWPAAGAAGSARATSEQLEAELAELRAKELDELAAAHGERARALQAKSTAEHRVALARAAAAEQQAQIYGERAAALADGTPEEAQRHALLADVAAERARAHKQLALAEVARMEAAGLHGAAAELARARAEMHERWQAVRSARALALEARASGDEQQATAHKAEAVARELIARAAEERIHVRSANDLERRRDGLRRFRPGLGSSFYSPGMVGTAGTASRLAARALVDLDREIEMIAEALRRHGPLERDELKRLIGGRYWGPGRFRMALRAAVNEGAATQRSRTVFAPGEVSRPSKEPTPTIARVTLPEYERQPPRTEGSQV